MVEVFKLEQLIRPKRLYSKLSSSLLHHISGLESLTEVIDSGFVSISMPEPLSKRRADYLKKLGVNALRDRSGDQVLTFQMTKVEDIVRLVKRPWVLRVEKSQQLHPVRLTTF